MSICAAALIAFDAGSGTRRVRIVATDQVAEATSKAIAPARSMGASPRENEWFTRTATPQIPTMSASPSLTVSLCVRRKMISRSAMKTGMVASTTAVTPEGTRCSAQNKQP